MSMSLEDFMQDPPGGIDLNPPETILDHYGWRMLGPQDNKDAVIFSRSIDKSVVPTGARRSLPRGRIFSMTPQGTVVPGIAAADALSVVVMLIGSASDSGDVLGWWSGDPETHPDGSAAMKDAYNASFQSLAAGYVYETSEFDRTDVTKYVPGTLLTTTEDELNDFDTAGLLKPARPHIDQVVGVVVRGLEGSTSNHSLQCIAVQGLAIPKLTKEMIAAINA